MRYQRSDRTWPTDWSPRLIGPVWRYNPIFGSPPCREGHSFLTTFCDPCHSSGLLCPQTDPPNAPSCWPPLEKPMSSWGSHDSLRVCTEGSLHDGIALTRSAYVLD